MFAEPAPVAWPIAGFTAAALVLVGALTARRRAAGLHGTVLEVFWADGASIGMTLAGVLTGASVAAIVAVEGIGQPVWILVGLVAVIAAGGLLLARWRSQELGAAARRRSVTPTAAPERRLVSTSWEFGMLGAGIGGFGTYLLTAGHAFGHPIHWLVTALGLAIGYAFGIGAVTPRFRLEAPAAGRS
ncbi:MAG: hypothetical protein HYX57_12745 [Chloroflexi bacterium]|nr:hypothetical protein [Chloroflexota bacterium]